MTREERINSALLPILGKMREHGATDEMCKMYDNGFHVGAMWADAHPHWISVFDETPKVDMLIFVVQLGKVTTFRYQYERAEVLKNVFGITHWMPLPQAPMKGGEE